MDVKVYKAKMPEAYARVKWCLDTLGKSVQNGCLRWWRSKGELYFRYEDDFIMYKLVWS